MDFIKEDTTKQVQAPLNKLTGKIASPYLFAELQADLIDFSGQPYQKYKYILLVQDVFSRLVFGIATISKQPNEILSKFEELCDKLKEEYAEFEIRRITTDEGSEFRLFDKYNHKLKTSLRSLATLDNAIGSFKKALVRDMRNNRTDDWPSRVDKIIKGQNNKPKEYLYDNEPEDVPDDEDLRAKLRDKNQEFSLINKFEIESRQQALEHLGKFRVAKNRKTFHRGWYPNWGDEVHTVASFDFDSVTDQDGNEYKTKHVLPIRGNTDAPARSIELGKNLATNQRARDTLHDLKSQIVNRFGPGVVTLARIGTYVKTVPNSKNIIRDARINMKAPILNMLRLFPDNFAVNGPDVTIRRA